MEAREKMIQEIEYNKYMIEQLSLSLNQVTAFGDEASRKAIVIDIEIRKEKIADLEKALEAETEEAKEEYSIIEEGFSSMAIVEWHKGTTVEYSIHTLDYQNKPLIYGSYDSGKYYNTLEEAQANFTKYSKKNYKPKKRIDCIICEGTGILNGDDCPHCNGFGYRLV